MEYLKSECLQNSIRKSWKVSKRHNSMPNLDKSFIKVREDRLEYILKSNQKLIDVFKSSVQSLVKTIKHEYVFILTDPELMVLAYTKSDSSMLGTLDLGMSFCEKSLGTNAISLAKSINKAVYIKPEDHYSVLLKEWYCFALPLRVDKKIIGYLDVSTVNKELKAEMIQVIDFLTKDIVTGYRRCCVKADIKVSQKQREVLKYLVKDMTDYEIASELACSVSNIKQHKRNLRRIFRVQSEKGIISKSIKLGIVYINKINI
ncbi:helix-turn-helix transcriptional regulator [Natronospora cellulosivora (SeqCode)]